MTILEKIEHFKTVWRTLIPHIAEPQTSDAVNWAGYSVGAVERAILGVAKKFAAHKIDAASFDPVAAYRYTSALARKNVERASGQQ